MSFSAYYTIAQIAATLIGFIAILIALQHNDQKFSRLAVITILETAIGALIFSFIPELLMSFLSDEIAWRISCGVFGLYHLFFIVYHQSKQLQFKKNSPVHLLIVIISIFGSSIIEISCWPWVFT